MENIQKNMKETEGATAAAPIGEKIVMPGGNVEDVTGMSVDEREELREKINER